MDISTHSIDTIKPFLRDCFVPECDSHKGQNGRLLVIGGSEHFHAASLWAAETASHIVDIVHYASTQENNEILLTLRKKFRNGIIVPREALLDYVVEDDAILIGPGMERGALSDQEATPISSFSDIIELEHTSEPRFTHELIRYLLRTFPDKQYVLDAGGLQMTDPAWFSSLSRKPIITPHQQEFRTVFGISLEDCSLEEKRQITQQTACTYNCVILLKAVTDIVSDGEQTVTIAGGNQGLTKGGTGDVLAGLTASFATKNSPIPSSVLASFLLKKTADILNKEQGYWYNVGTLIESFPKTLHTVMERL